MTENTTTTTPTPPEGLTVTDSELLRAYGLASRAVSHRARLDGRPEPAEGSRTIAGIRAAIAAHEAARPAPAPAPVPSFLDAIRLADGCHDYSGGYRGAEGEAWHAAIDTVVTVLRRAATRPWDRQTAAVFALGADTPSPTSEEIDAQFRAWWAESYPNAPAGTHAVSSHVAFALYLLSRGVL